MVNKPKTYIDKIDNVNPRYCFISYAHKDHEEVYQILEKLFDRNVNYWYDKELKPGDKWDDKVEDYLINNNCKGVFIFLSESSLNSEAVQKEIELVKVLKEKDESFFVIPVIIDYESMDDILIYMIMSKKNNLRHSLEDITSKGTIIYVNSKDFDEKIDDIMSQLDSCNVTGNGVNPDKTINEIDGIFMENKHVYLKKGEYMISLENKKEDIVWELFAQENDKIYFVTKYAIDFISYSDLNSKLKEIKNLVMDEKYIDDCVFLTTDMLSLYSNSIGRTYPTDYADTKRGQQMRLFWVKDNENFILCNSENKKVSISNNVETLPINAGIRFVLIIDNSQISDVRIKKVVK